MGLFAFLHVPAQEFSRQSDHDAAFPRVRAPQHSVLAVSLGVRNQGLASLFLERECRIRVCLVFALSALEQLFCMYVSMNACLYLCIYVCMCVCVQICIYGYTYIYIYMYVCMHMYVYTYIYIYIYI